MTAIDLRLGHYRDVCADVVCDLFCCDGPYGEGTHAGVNDYIGGRGGSLPDCADRMQLAYSHWTDADVRELVEFWHPRTRGWMVCFTSDDLIGAYKAAYRAAGRYAFAPVPVIQPRPRLGGDGPASWAVYLMVSRPRTREFATWGCLPGEYRSHTDRTGIVAGAKPIELMREIVSHYSRPGDLVADACVGGGSTLIAAVLEGRSAVGSEIDAETHAKALRRIELATSEYPIDPSGKQQGLFTEGA